MDVFSQKGKDPRIIRPKHRTILLPTQPKFSTHGSLQPSDTPDTPSVISDFSGPLIPLKHPLASLISPIPETPLDRPMPQTHPPTFSNFSDPPTSPTFMTAQYSPEHGQ